MYSFPQSQTNFFDVWKALVFSLKFSYGMLRWSFPKQYWWKVTSFSTGLWFIHPAVAGWKCMGPKIYMAKNTYQKKLSFSSQPASQLQSCQHSGEGIMIVKSHQWNTKMPFVIISNLSFISEFCASVSINKFIFRFNISFHNKVNCISLYFICHR